MVSKIGHALNDLLFRAQNGQLPVTIVAIVSNHPDFASVAQTAGIPFHHLPVTKDTKAEAERRLLEIVDTERVKLVVMVRIPLRQLADRAGPLHANSEQSCLRGR